VYDFDADTANRSHHAPGPVRISDRWSNLGGRPNGGYLLTHLTQLAASGSAHPDPLVVSGIFAHRSGPELHESSWNLRITGAAVGHRGTLRRREGPALLANTTFTELCAVGSHDSRA
jgi:hypothetical protein